MVTVKYMGPKIPGIPAEIDIRRAGNVGQAKELIKSGIAKADAMLFDKAKILLNHRPSKDEDLLKDGDELYILPYLGSG
ncbi:MAG: MoaD/ThiS family protein [Eubacteriaceae bacterium]|nr:MoaD/ThiS family protein [Eubacteriaceae bacterium]